MTRATRLTPRGRLFAAVAALAGVIAVIGIAAIAIVGDPAPGGVPTIGGTGAGRGVIDPFAWDAGRAGDFSHRAAVSTSAGLYRLAPGGVPASAARTERWRPLVARAAAAAGVDADTLEGLVFLESGGRDDATTAAGIDGAVGLTQILAGTATDLLHMHVDTAQSAALTRKLEQATRPERVTALRRARARADERFDGGKSLAGTARYLKLARTTFGREDLAFAAYHMGIGNLEGVIRAFTGRRDGTIAEVVAGAHLSYPELFFASTPASHPAAYARLSGLGDESATYLFKIEAARDILREFRTDRAGLEARAAHGGPAAPGAGAPRIADRAALRAASGRHEILAIPDRPAETGLKLTQPAGLRPEALALALYVGVKVRAMSGAQPLTVVSGIRPGTGEAATGLTFEMARRYVSPRQAFAFQFALDRLQLLGVIAYVRRADAIQITVSPGARQLLPLLDRIQPGG
jgi:hypothetical protein